MKRGTARADHRASRVRRTRMLGTHYRWLSQAKFGATWTPLGGGRLKGPGTFGSGRRNPATVALEKEMSKVVDGFVRGLSLMHEPEDET